VVHGQPTGWQLALTTAGMVSIVNNVVIGATAGLVLAALGVESLAVTLAAGASRRRSIGTPLSSPTIRHGGCPEQRLRRHRHTVTGPDASALDVARYQGQRLARYATVTAEARSR
jgi:hypothetical protein